jgi:hypothetical protein
MIIERFFGKGREAKGKPRGKDEANPRRSPGKPAETEAPLPRIEATDAPAAMARSGEAGMASAATRPPIVVEPVPEPSNEEIAARAYDLWQAQGRPTGRERENWSEAERQLRAERARG